MGVGSVRIQSPIPCGSRSEVFDWKNGRLLTCHIYRSAGFFGVRQVALDPDSIGIPVTIRGTSTGQEVPDLRV